MSQERMAPVHTGEILLEDFMRSLQISQYRLAKEMKVYPRKILEIVNGKRSTTADTALRLARFFGTSAEVMLKAGQVRLGYLLRTRNAHCPDDGQHFV